MEEKKVNLTIGKLVINYVFIFLFGLFLGWVYASTEDVAQNNGLNQNTETVYQFDWTGVQVGQMIAGLKISAVEKYQSEADLEFWENAKIQFTGTTEISGNKQMIFDQLCFVAEDKQIPVMLIPGGETKSGFCFSNQNLAQELLGDFTENEKLEIVISDFVLNSYPSEVGNVAQLVEVK